MNTFGKNIRLSIFGESHGDCVGITIDGLPSGIVINQTKIKEMLKIRQGLKDISTPRDEDNDYQIISGYFENHTTGAPLTFLIKNHKADSSQYKDAGLIRPSHADYPLYQKYNGQNDYRGGGHASGRLTVALVIVGAICDQLLEEENIFVFSHINSVKNIKDTSIDIQNLSIEKIKVLKSCMFPTFDERGKILMIEQINKAKKNNDAVGGTIETFAIGVPIGLGEPFFDSLESLLAHAIFSIPGVKSLEFGDGIAMCNQVASKIVDQMAYNNGQITFLSNHQGGINGGISNGNYLNFRVGVRAPSSISTPLSSIDLKKHETVIVQTIGKHDPTIVHRVLPVVNAMTSFILLDLLLENKKYE